MGAHDLIPARAIPRPNAPASGVAASESESESAGLVLEAGKVIAQKYRLERPAGFGGMAQLWVATNQSTGAEVCVKLLVPDAVGGEDGSPPKQDEEAVERFRREAHAAARLSHRAIIRIFDLLELDANGDAVKAGGGKGGKATTPHAYGIVMELLRGETLGDLLAKREKIPLEEALDLFLPVVSALAHAHRASVIHRDLKPDNIFLALDPDGLVIPKVLDFGVSKLSNADAITIDGVVVGTPSFMSPEQAKGARHLDPRSDVFSAGVLFYMMLSGANPFEDRSFSNVIEAILRREVPPLPDLPAELWSVIHQALEKDPAARFNDATEMGIALRKAAGRKQSTESAPVLPLAPRSSSSLAPPSGSAPVSAPISSSLRIAAGASAGVNESESPSLDLGASGAHSTSSAVLSVRATNPKHKLIVAAVVGAALAIALAGLLIAQPWSQSSKKAAASVSVSGPPSVSSPSAAPTPIPTPTPTPAETASETVEPAPDEKTAPPAAHPKSLGGARGGKKPQNHPSGPVRKPGQEPNGARAPGF